MTDFLHAPYETRQLDRHIRTADAVSYADASEILLESDHGVVLRFTPDDGPLWGQAQAKAAELLEAQWRRHNSLRPLADVIRTQAVLLKIEFGHAQYHASLEHARQLDRSYFALLRRLAERAA